MAVLLDTDVAIHLRDGGPAVPEKVSALGDAVLLSIVTRVELEGGVYRDPAYRDVRRVRLDTIFAAVPTLALRRRGCRCLRRHRGKRRLFAPQAARPHDCRAGARASRIIGDDECRRLRRRAGPFAAGMVKERATIHGIADATPRSR